MPIRPRYLHTALDAPDARALAEFYRQFLGLHYRAGDEPPADGSPDDADWLVLVDEDGQRGMAIQHKPGLPRSTWPSGEVPMQAHIDYGVPDVAALDSACGEALALGATVLHDRSGDPDEPLYVLADPAGHPFCVLVAPELG